MAPQSLTTIEEAMEFASEAISRGEIQVGKEALSWVLQQSPSHPTAWMWMAQIFFTNCLANVSLSHHSS
jgi:Tfp pilus assembly protein PilF